MSSPVASPAENPDPSKRKRGWRWLLQFRLRTILLLTQRQAREKTRRDEPAKKLMVDPEDLRKTLDDADDLKPGLLEEQMEYLKSL